jgi:hypothetical protein
VGLKWISLERGAYLLNAFNGLGESQPHVFHLLVGGEAAPFAANWHTISPALRVRTRTVATPVRGG